MPSKTAKQQRFFGAELGRAKAGKKTRTGMSIGQLEDFASKRTKKAESMLGKGAHAGVK